MRQEVKVATTARAIVVLQAVLAAVVSIWACANEEIVYAAIGMISLLIVIFPFLFLKTYDLFCPWSTVVLSFAVLATPQAVCMSFDWPSVEAIENSMLLGRTPEYFIYPGGIFLLGIACFTIGYFCFDSQIKRRLTISRGFNQSNMFFVLGACVLVSIAATLAYIRFTGGHESGTISSKRVTIQTLDVQSDDSLNQHGSLRMASKLSTIVFLTLFSFYLVRNERLSFIQTVIVGSAFFIAFALPFYASSRGEICWMTLSGLGVVYYFRKPKFVKTLVVVAGFGLTVFLLMSFLRSSDDIEDASFAHSFGHLVLNRNGPGLSKTAHIINHIPEPLSYKYGETILVWLIAPVPRRLFPSKPLIHTGPVLGNTIFGTRVSGVPPGAIAELYWNFHIPGVIFGMLLLGWCVQMVYKFLKSVDIDPAIITPLYLFTVLPIGFGVLGHSVGGGTVMRVFEFCVASVVIFLCTESIRTKQ